VADEQESPSEGNRSATLVAIAIVLSRLVGLLRQRVTAYYFGTSLLADGIAAAFRIGNLAQNLLGEGTLSATFIPIYAKLRAQGREADAKQFARDALGALTALVVLVSAAGVAAAPWLTLAVAGGLHHETRAITVELVRWLFPMTGLLVLSAWALGVLNAHRSFFVPYAAPALWSAAQIAALLIAGSWLLVSGEQLARVLAHGALAGAAVTLGFLLVRARRFVGSIWPSFRFTGANLREAAARFPGVLLGRGMIQISGLVDTLLVSFLGAGAVSSFSYAQMIYLLPMSVLGTGEAAAALPEMAGDSAEADRKMRDQRIRDRLARSLTRVAVLATPAIAAMCLFGEELVAVLLRTGQFDRESTLRVAAALRIYGLALLGNASVRLFGTAFFALGDTRTPARMATLRVLASTAIALALMKPLGVVGVVLGAMCAAWIEALWLGRALRSVIGGLGLAGQPFGRMTVLAVACCGPGLALKGLLGARSAEPQWAAAILAAVVLSFALGATLTRLLDLRSLLWRR
jgi:putative peptidoglycan lipid II flippase